LAESAGKFSFLLACPTADLHRGAIPCLSPNFGKVPGALGSGVTGWTYFRVSLIGWSMFQKSWTLQYHVFFILRCVWVWGRLNKFLGDSWLGFGFIGKYFLYLCQSTLFKYLVTWPLLVEFSIVYAAARPVLRIFMLMYLPVLSEPTNNHC